MPGCHREHIIVWHIERGAVPIGPAVAVVDRVLTKDGSLAQARLTYLISQHTLIALVKRLTILAQPQSAHHELKLQTIRDRLGHATAGAAFSDSEQMDVNVE